MRDTFEARRKEGFVKVSPAIALAVFKRVATRIADSFLYYKDKEFGTILRLAELPEASSLSMDSLESINKIQQLKGPGLVFVSTLLQHFQGIMEDCSDSEEPESDWCRLIEYFNWGSVWQSISRDLCQAFTLRSDIVVVLHTFLRQDFSEQYFP